MALKRNSEKTEKQSNYENFNILDADGQWTSVNISYNADNDYADENFQAICDAIQEVLNVTITQDKPGRKKANFAKAS